MATFKSPLPPFEKPLELSQSKYATEHYSHHQNHWRVSIKFPTDVVVVRDYVFNARKNQIYFFDKDKASDKARIVASMNFKGHDGYVMKNTYPILPTCGEEPAWLWFYLDSESDEELEEEFDDESDEELDEELAKYLDRRLNMLM